MTYPVDADPGFAIRNATAADSEGVLECLRAAFEPFKTSYTPGAYTDTILSRTTLDQRLLEMVIFIAISNSAQIIGTTGCHMLTSEEGHLRGMAVLPSWQGRRVAQPLLDRTESELRKSGCRRITLDTTAPLTRAIRFYERNGFRSTGRVIDFFGMPLFEYEKRL